MFKEFKEFAIRGEEALPATKDCQFCASAIPRRATRCPLCTSQLAA